MDERGENDIKATGPCLYENGPLCAELHARRFVIPVLKKHRLLFESSFFSSFLQLCVRLMMGLYI